MIDVEKTLEKINASVKQQVNDWNESGLSFSEAACTLTNMLCQKEIVSLLVHILAELQKGNEK